MPHKTKQNKTTHTPNIRPSRCAIEILRSTSKELSLTLDITEEIAVVSYEPDDEVKEKKNITLTQEVIPFYLEKLDQTAAENGGHLALGKVSFNFVAQI